MPEPQPMLVERADPLSLEQLLAHARERLPSVVIESVQVIRWDTPEAEVRFYSGRSGADNGVRGQIALRASDGAVIAVQDPRDAELLARIDGWMTPLHFGDFGGLVLKTLYFILGLTPALLSVTGTWLWLERTQRERMA